MKRILFFVCILVNLSLFAQPESLFDTKQGYFDGMAIVGKNNKFGYVDKGNKIVIPILYDEAIAFSHGRAVVSLNGKRGIVDKTGKIIVPIEYANVTFLGSEESPDTTVFQAFIDTKSKDGCCFFDYFGKRICPSVSNIACDLIKIIKTQGSLMSFYYSKTVIDDGGDESTEYFKGVCERNGAILIQPMYGDIQFFDHLIYAKAKSYSVESSVFDMQGKELIKVKWLELKNGFFEYTKMDYSKGKISLDGKLL